jgi:hypothetical protein
LARFFFKADHIAVEMRRTKISEDLFATITLDFSLDEIENKLKKASFAFDQNLLGV